MGLDVFDNICIILFIVDVLQKMEVIAHRGASGYEPENTLAAFGKAIELKSDMIELDVRLSKDAEVIVFHDMTLARRTKKKGYVSKKTLEQLKAYDIGKGERIPTLKEVISFVDGRCKINIDIKDIKAVEEIVKIAGDRSNIIVSSNSVKILRLIKFKNFFNDLLFVLFCNLSFAIRAMSSADSRKKQS